MLNAIKWIGSCIIAVLLVGAGIAVVMLVFSLSTFIFIGVGIVGALALVAAGVRSLLNSK